MKKLPQVRFQDMGHISYQAAWDYQFEIQKKLIEAKRQKRELAEKIPQSADNQIFTQNHQLLFCEHNPVFTLGKSGSIDHLLLNETELEAQGIEFFKINRGGDITYHGPGQITGYPIFDMEEFFTDVHRYVRSLEEVVMRTLAAYDLKTMRIKEYTGVWLEATETLPKRKICAIGVHFSRWISMHGFALNVNTDLDYFKKIVPCGIDDADKTVTSLAQELGQVVDIQEVKELLKVNFGEVFGFDYER